MLRDRLSAYPFGLQWLDDCNVMRQWGKGKLLSEEEIRVRLITFMDENGVDTLESLVKAAVEQHESATRPRVLSNVGGKVLAYLKQGELSCFEIVSWLVDDDSKWTRSASRGPDEAEIFNHCVRKFNCENANQPHNSYVITINALMEAARIDPRLVGYVPEHSEEADPIAADQSKVVDLQERAANQTRATS